MLSRDTTSGMSSSSKLSTSLAMPPHADIWQSTLAGRSRMDVAGGFPHLAVQDDRTELLPLNRNVRVISAAFQWFSEDADAGG